MSYYSRKTAAHRIIFISALIGLTCRPITAAVRPEGLMLNLDLQQAKDGLIPSKTLYPLFVPQGELSLDKVKQRNVLAVDYGQGLNIPHSTLLDPDGREWSVSIRIYALTEGLIMSQANSRGGYALFIQNGTVQAAIHTGTSTILLRERADQIPTKGLNHWLTISLRIKPEMAMLTLNQKRVALAHLQAPLKGDNMHIRLGNHSTLPEPFENSTLPTTGFTGAIGSLKLHRQ